MKFARCKESDSENAKMNRLETNEPDCSQTYVLVHRVANDICINKKQQEKHELGI